MKGKVKKQLLAILLSVLMVLGSVLPATSVRAEEINSSFTWLNPPKTVTWIDKENLILGISAPEEDNSKLVLSWVIQSDGKELGSDIATFSFRSGKLIYYEKPIEYNKDKGTITVHKSSGEVEKNSDGLYHLNLMYDTELVKCANKNKHQGILSVKASFIKGTTAYNYSLKNDNNRIYNEAPDLKLTEVSAVPDELIKVTDISISIPNNDKKIVYTGHTESISADVYPITAQNKELKWSSSNEKVVTVSQQSGTKVGAFNTPTTIKGISSGTAIITAEATDGSGVKAKYVVTVTDEISTTSASINYTEKTISVGESFDLTVSMEPYDTTDAVDWWCEGTGGTFGRLPVKYNTSKGKGTYTIKIQGLEKSNITFKIYVLPVGARLAYLVNTGYIVAGGTARFVFECKVNVVKENDSNKDKVSEVSINPESIELLKGNSETLTAAVKPENASNKEISWSSTNQKVVTVDQNGRIIAIGRGTASVIATSKDNPEVTAECKVTVQEITDLNFYLGDNVDGKLDDDGILTVYGKGDTLSVDSYFASGLYTYSDYIKKIVVEDGITSIGSYIFGGLNKVTEVVLPESVQTIETGAFADDTSLTKINIPKGITKVGKNIFGGCTKLKSITFMGNAPDFDENAFGDSISGLSGVTIYYPIANTTWTSEKLKNYGGTDIIWKTWGQINEKEYKLIHNLPKISNEKKAKAFLCFIFNKNSDSFDKIDNNNKYLKLITGKLSRGTLREVRKAN